MFCDIIETVPRVISDRSHSTLGTQHVLNENFASDENWVRDERSYNSESADVD